MTVILEKGEWPEVDIGCKVQYKGDGPAIVGRLEDIDYHNDILSYFVRRANKQLAYCEVLSLRRMRKMNRNKYPKSQKNNRNLHLDDLIIVKD